MNKLYFLSGLGVTAELGLILVFGPVKTLKKNYSGIFNLIQKTMKYVIKSTESPLLPMI